MTLITILPLWVRLVSGQEVGSSGGNDCSEGNLPASHEPASRVPCSLKGGSPACLLWLWPGLVVAIECEVSPFPAATEGLLAAEWGTGQLWLVPLLACASPGLIATSAIGLGWAPPTLHPPPDRLLPLGTPHLLPASPLLHPHLGLERANRQGGA